MRIRTLVVAACLSLSLSACATRASAQAVRVPRPTASECDIALREFRRDPKAQSLQSQIAVARCGPAAGPVLAAALRASAHSSDTTLFSALLPSLTRFRDIRVMEAAIDVAVQGSATSEARTAAVMILVSQYNPETFVPASSWRVLLTEPSSIFTCTASLTDMASEIGMPLPADYKERISSALDRVVEEQGTDRPLGSLAACVRKRMRSSTSD